MGGRGGTEAWSAGLGTCQSVYGDQQQGQEAALLLDLLGQVRRGAEGQGGKGGHRGMGRWIGDVRQSEYGDA